MKSGLTRISSATRATTTPRMSFNNWWRSSGSMGTGIKHRLEFGPIPPRPSGLPRCLNCGSLDHTIADCPKPEVPKDERPCFECGTVGHLARDCPSKPQAQSEQRQPARFTRRPPARANNMEKALNQISFLVQKGPPSARKTISSSCSRFGSSN